MKQFLSCFLPFYAKIGILKWHLRQDPVIDIGFSFLIQAKFFEQKFDFNEVFFFKTKMFFDSRSLFNDSFNKSLCKGCYF